MVTAIVQSDVGMCKGCDLPGRWTRRLVFQLGTLDWLFGDRRAMLGGWGWDRVWCLCCSVKVFARGFRVEGFDYGSRSGVTMRDGLRVIDSLCFCFLVG